MCYGDIIVIILYFFFVLGIFSFVSCMIVSSFYYDDRKGWEFILVLWFLVILYFRYLSNVFIIKKKFWF